MDASTESFKTRLRHHEMLKAGAICTAHDNSYIDDFDQDHPCPSITNLADQLDALACTYNPDGHPFDEHASLELRAAAAEISRRLAGEIDGLPAQAGHLIDSAQLDIGDQLDLTRIWNSDTSTADRVERALQGPVTVLANLDLDYGDPTILTDYGPLDVPAGTYIPVLNRD